MGDLYINLLSFYKSSKDQEKEPLEKTAKQIIKKKSINIAPKHCQHFTYIAWTHCQFLFLVTDEQISGCQLQFAQNELEILFRKVYIESEM